MFRNPASFVLMSKEAFPSYKLQLLDVSFKACMSKVDSGILINHAEILKDMTAKYPLTRTEVKMNTCTNQSCILLHISKSCQWSLREEPI